MKNEINILFLGGAKRVSLAERFISSGQSLGYEIKIFSYELDRFVPISSLAEIIIGLKWNDKKIYEHLLKTIKEKKIDIILPFVDPATIIAAKLKTMSNNIFIPVSDLSTMEIFFDKYKSNKWFIHQNLNLPLPKDGEFPIIAKPIFGSASKGLIIIRNKKEFKAFKNNDNINNYLIQRFIEGDEFTVDCYISQNGEIISMIPRKRIEITGGEVTKAITVRDLKILNEVQRILATGIFSGPINIQFIKDKITGEIFIMEINPRFGGGVPLTIQSGADFTMFMLREYLGLEIQPIFDWKENLVMARSFRETFIDATDN